MITRTLLLSAVMAAATALVGWWGVPLVSFVYALLRKSLSAPNEAAVAAAVAWIGLLAFQSKAAAFGVLLQRIDGIFPVSGVAVLAAAVVFAALLAWSFARTVIGVTYAGK